MVMKLAEKEKIVKVIPVTDGDNVGIVTKDGWMLLFPENNLRTMGKTA